MHDLQQCKCLCPFGEVAHTADDIFEADEWDEEDDTAQDGSPEDSADEIVGDEVLGLLLAVGGGSGIHWERDLV